MHTQNLPLIRMCDLCFLLVLDLVLVFVGLGLFQTCLHFPFSPHSKYHTLQHHPQTLLNQNSTPPPIFSYLTTMTALLFSLSSSWYNYPSPISTAFNVDISLCHQRNLSGQARPPLPQQLHWNLAVNKQATTTTCVSLSHYLFLALLTLLIY